MLATIALAAVSVLTGTSSAVAAEARTTAAPVARAAFAPNEPRYFLGTGYGPYNIALNAAYNTAYAAAASEGYASSSCLSAGPAPNELSSGYYQIMLEIQCVPPTPVGANQIVGVRSNERPNVRYGKTENGSLLGMNSCHGAPNQQWQLLESGLLRSVHSDKCLDALGWGTDNGTRVGIWDCAPHHTDQQWQGAGLGT
ncbi:hypothetical protein EF919_39265 [Streptomyces sp. WAC02707]|uniref:RICIN domain-containing protein n=1 Tax=Streptomyces sp. WAC02707 TaxID=2487417 RepID=UPI000F782D34|nr:RICIN domain-containing protein [Streptomyces sp. WAC02707]RSS83276.1 hypothetical protein EF919_39265 [Streptomyces sp. WAC02707]